MFQAWTDEITEGETAAKRRLPTPHRVSATMKTMVDPPFIIWVELRKAYV